MGIFKMAIVLTSLVVVVSCNKKDSDSFSSSESAADQIGDVMASIDESGGATGSYAMMSRESRMFASMAPGLMQDSKISSMIFPQAMAASCFVSNSWGGCTGNKIIRTFSGCAIGTATLSGTVTLTFDDGNVNNVCSLASNGNSISREPNFTITSAGGGEYSVSKSGTYGQKVTRISSGHYEFTNDGIKRTVSYKGTILADFTTITTTALGDHW